MKTKSKYRILSTMDHEFLFNFPIICVCISVRVSNCRIVQTFNNNIAYNTERRPRSPCAARNTDARARKHA